MAIFKSNMAVPLIKIASGIITVISIVGFMCFKYLPMIIVFLGVLGVYVFLLKIVVWTFEGVEEILAKKRSRKEG